MKSIELFSIGIRLLGIYLLLNCFEFIGLVASSYQSFASIDSGQQFSWVIGIYVVILIFIFALSIFLIKFPYTTAKLLMPMTADGPILNGSALDFQIIGITLLGIYGVFTSLPLLVSNVTYLYLSSNNDLASMFTQKFMIGASSNVTKLLIGVFFTFRSKAFTAFIKKYEK